MNKTNENMEIVKTEINDMDARHIYLYIQGRSSGKYTQQDGGEKSTIIEEMALKDIETYLDAITEYDEAYENGQCAYIDGESINSCIIEDEDLKEAWIDGYETAKEGNENIICDDPVEMETNGFLTAQRITTYDEAFHEGNYAFSEGHPFNSCTLDDEQLKKAWEEGWLYQEVYKQGEIAFHSGLYITECPYEDEELIKAWKYGWINETI